MRNKWTVRMCKIAMLVVIVVSFFHFSNKKAKKIQKGSVRTIPGTLERHESMVKTAQKIQQGSVHNISGTPERHESMVKTAQKIQQGSVHNISGTPERHEIMMKTPQKIQQGSVRTIPGTPERHEIMIKTAKKIQQTSKTVLVAIINNAYLPLAYSWLCNTKEMDIHKSVLFITTDQYTQDKLKNDWPEVSAVSMGMTSLRGDRSFGQVGYLKLNVKRHQYIYQLLQEGFELLHFEVDAVWLKNPLPFLQGQKGYDLVVNAGSSTAIGYQSGFVYIFNTNKAVRVWELLARKMTELDNHIAIFRDDKKLDVRINDQPFWNNIIQNKVAGLKLKVLTIDQFADGIWYRPKSASARKNNDPYVIQNNWVIGKIAKVKRAKEWGHWFIKDDMTCDMDQVHKAVKT